MNDITMTILADFGNLLSHLNIFKSHNHSVSCLICGSKETKNLFSKRSDFYPIQTSSDLVLLHSGNNQENRQLIFLNGNEKRLDSEKSFERELKLNLNFTFANELIPIDKFAILVLVIGPYNKLEIKDIMNWIKIKKMKQLILIAPYNKFSLNSCLYYHDYEKMLNYLVHISMITKQRIRFKDIRTYLPLSVGNFQTEYDENQCLFI